MTPPTDDNNTFDDYEAGDGPDDSDTLDAYAAELTAAVEAFGVLVFEPGEERA